MYLMLIDYEKEIVDDIVDYLLNVILLKVNVREVGSLDLRFEFDLL